MDHSRKHKRGVAALRICYEDLLAVDDPFAGPWVPCRSHTHGRGVGAANRLGETDGDRLVAPARVLFRRASNLKDCVAKRIPVLPQTHAAVPIPKKDERADDLAPAGLVRMRFEHGARVWTAFGFGVARGQQRVFVVLEVARVANGNLGLSSRFLQYLAVS